MTATDWTPERLMDLIAHALRKGDLDTVVVAMKVLAVKSPGDAQSVMDMLDLAAVMSS